MLHNSLGAIMVQMIYDTIIFVILISASGLTTNGQQGTSLITLKHQLRV